jgi:hypothetical protein
MEDRTEFIEDELARRGVDYKPYKEDYLVSCPWHTRKAWKKKLAIHKSGTMVHCWTCKKSGNWNTYAEAMGMQKIDFDKPLPPDLKGLEDDIRKFEEDEAPVTKLHGLVPWVGEWRGISEEFLRSVPSYKWYDMSGKQHGYRIVWPVTFKKKLLGYTSQRVDETLFLKQKNMCGLNAKEALFPLDHPLIKDRVVLVEGAYDAFRLLAAGIPALCILGTSTWSKSKISLLIAMGIKIVVLAFDGDKEGRILQPIAQADLEEAFDVRIFDCPDGKDPGNMEDRLLKVLRMTLR